MTELYPWLQHTFAGTVSALQQSQHHAWLIHSKQGTGKQNLAHHLSKYLLCEQQQASLQACGSCSSCQLFAAGNHPDWHIINDLEGDKQQAYLKVDQIRDLSLSLSTTPQISRRKVVLLYPAEKMNMEAANSFLKTLEEPPGDTVFILLSSQLYSLPATILSRCIKVFVQLNDESSVLQWLKKFDEDTENCKLAWQLSCNAPLLAADYLQNKLLDSRLQCFAVFENICQKRESISSLAQWQEKKKLALEIILQWLYSWLSDLCKIQLGIANKTLLQNQDIASRLEAIMQKKVIKHPFEQQRRLEKILVMDKNSLNGQIILDDILVNIVMN